MRQLVYEKENFEFNPVKLHLKTDLVSYPARAQGLVNRVSSFEKFPSTYKEKGVQGTYRCERTEVDNNQL